MSADPLVCCIMLTKDRPEMAKRAVESFRRQTYQRKRLYVFDTGKIPCVEILPDGYPDFNIVYHRGRDHGSSIGALRNLANWWGCRSNSSNPPDADILIHFDDDDWSHPNRITEQVALLRASGKQCVGYRDLLFWKDKIAPDVRANVENLMAGFPPDAFPLPDHLQLPAAEAWLYTNQDPRYCLGTSLAYLRSAWEARPFPDISRGEDRNWLREIDSMGISSLGPSYESDRLTKEMMDPRMIASIHSGNHVKYETTSAEWKRVPEWDAYCRERMAL